MIKTTFTLLKTGGLLSLVGLAFFLGSGGKLPAAIEGLVIEEVTEVDMRPVILAQVQSAAELVTAKQAFEVTVPITVSREFLGANIGDSTLVYAARGNVSAGVDLSELTVDNIQQTEQGLVLLVPAPKILDAKLDVINSEILSQHQSLLGPDKQAQMLQEAQQKAHLEIMSKACSEGILEEAAKNTAAALELIVKVQVPEGSCTPAQI